MREIKIIDKDEAERIAEEGTVTQRLVTAKDGSPDMTFGISSMPLGHHDPAVIYPDHDEIIFIVSGVVEFTINDATQSLGAGKSIFIPKGETYGYKVVEGPNEVYYVFSPAKN
jgi:quercetin dioxygenase-like cupin family protein